MLDVRKLRLLRELAHRGTIAAVAEALSYTPSAVSQQLTALERETGVPLLERTGRRVTLTPAAHGLVARTESILALLNAAAADLENASRALSGVLRIGAFPTAVRPLITPALVALSTQHPALSLTVCELDPAAVPDALRTETVDLALLQHYDHLPRPHHPSLQTDPLHTDPVHLATPAPPPTSPDTRHPMPSPTPPTTP
ncbi:LysR family transcriptional regulator, partial [Kribbella sandramycini]